MEISFLNWAEKEEEEEKNEGKKWRKSSSENQLKIGFMTPAFCAQLVNKTLGMGWECNNVFKGLGATALGKESEKGYVAKELGLVGVFS